MNREKFISQIIKYYGFGEERERKQIQRFVRKVGDRDLEDLSEIYDYVTTTLDWESVTPKIRYAKSLDAKISRESDDSFHVLIGRNDAGFDDLFQKGDRVSVVDGIKSIADLLDEKEFDILQGLANIGAHNFDLNPSVLLSTTPEIRERLEYITKAFYVNDRISIPRKRVLITEKNGELHIQVGDKITGDQLIKIYDAHKNGLSPYKVALEVGLSHITVRDIWRKAGLESATKREDGVPGGIPIPLEKQAIIFECYFAGLSTYATAKYVGGVSATTVRKYWASEGLLTKNKSLSRINPNNKTNSLNEGQIKEILGAHRVYGGNAFETSRNLPYSYGTITKYWKREGLSPLRRGPKPKDK